MKKYLISGVATLLLATLPSGVWSQTTRTVTGRVIDAATGRVLSGAMVRTAEMHAYSTLTDSTGNWQLTLPQHATVIEVTAPDHNPVRMGLSGQAAQRDVMLYPATFSNEYGQNDNIGADACATDFSYTSALSIEEEIQQRLGAAVHATMRSGTPGMGGVMMLSGLNSLNATAQPLIVVDGVIFDQQYHRNTLHSGFYNNILTNINPADIERVTVLRNGTAIYGAKGANGVIDIRTRRNHSMATRITATLSAGVTLEPRYLQMMDAGAYRNYASDLLKTTRTDIREFKFLNEDPSYYYYPQYHNDTDWKNHMYRTAMTQNYGISVEGGDQVADYRLSLGYTGSQSTLRCNDMNRVNIRFNTDIRLTKRLAVRFDASFANQTRNLRDDGAPENYTEGTPTSTSFLAYAKSPMLSPFSFSGGRIYGNFVEINDESYLDEALANYRNYNYKLANPLAINAFGDAENKNHFENSMINLTVTPQYKIGRHLTLSEHFSYNLVNTNEKLYVPLDGVPDYYVSSVNAYCRNEVRTLAAKQHSVMSNTRLDWNRRIGAHSLQWTAGVRINWESYTSTAQLGYNTSSDKIPSISSSLDHARTYGENDSWNGVAWYAQAGYNYRQRYYVQASLAAEASSRFGTDAGLRLMGAPWGLFPGIEAAWVVSNEHWLAGVRGIDYLRLSAGFDVSGNDDIDYRAARSYFGTHNFLQDVSALSLENIGNTRLQWETTRRLNASLEGNFFSNRLNLRLCVFHSVTDHLLMYQRLGTVSGIARNWANEGSMENDGMDASMTLKAVTTKNVQWELGGSIGHYRNRITKLADSETFFDTHLYGGTVRTEVGRPANLFYGYKTLGVFATSEQAAEAGLSIPSANGIDKTSFGAGDMIFADLDGDHLITEADRTFIGDPNPDIYGNLFTSVAYRRLRLDVRLNYSVGGDVYNYLRSQLEGGCRFMNQTTAMIRRWQTEGQQTDMPRACFQDVMDNARFSDRWIEDGSYLKLKAVTLSYTLPMHSTLLQGFQFWIQANNLLTLSRYLGSDPETAMTSNVIGQGIDTGLLPQSRSFVAGIKINL